MSGTQALPGDLGLAGDLGGRGGARPKEEWKVARYREGFGPGVGSGLTGCSGFGPRTGKGLQVEGVAWEKLGSKKSQHGDAGPCAKSQISTLPHLPFR